VQAFCEHAAGVDAAKSGAAPFDPAVASALLARLLVAPSPARSTQPALAFPLSLPSTELATSTQFTPLVHSARVQTARGRSRGTMLLNAPHKVRTNAPTLLIRRALTRAVVVAACVCEGSAVCAQLRADSERPGHPAAGVCSSAQHCCPLEPGVHGTLSHEGPPVCGHRLAGQCCCKRCAGGSSGRCALCRVQRSATPRCSRRYAYG
jgi:hypothetical protein